MSVARNRRNLDTTVLQQYFTTSVTRNRKNSDKTVPQQYLTTSVTRNRRNSDKTVLQQYFITSVTHNRRNSDKTVFQQHFTTSVTRNHDWSPRRRQLTPRAIARHWVYLFIFFISVIHSSFVWRISPCTVLRSKLLWNVATYPSVYTASHARRRYSFPKFNLNLIPRLRHHLFTLLFSHCKVWDPKSKPFS